MSDNPSSKRSNAEFPPLTANLRDVTSEYVERLTGILRERCIDRANGGALAQG
ncbi:hypothetical protein EYZ11_009459 [Aspergillus tanneri]|uniref:Uncharacterized protein n=1 Tax=Aspergillus tanneri TaxID=1220188 RepID=A0A4V3UNG0_9EURO|nr:hypothetical protein EYZ11_009459 [Aspergillus tanneri]